jgi:hypothetical protein
VKFLPFLIGAIIAGGAALAFAMIPGQPQPVRDIVGSAQGNSMMPVVFENATNLTDNEQDSVYGQVAALESSVYVLWQDSVSGRNYDIFIKKSDDNGTTFGAPVNISNNPGFSEHPQLSVFGNNVYATWPDNTPGNREVLFSRSTDGGTTFGEAQNLSNNPSNSHNAEMAAFGDNVYVVWADQDNEENNSILLTASSDGGATFGRTANISSQANFGSFPKVAAYGSNVYVTWNVLGSEADDGLYFAKSTDGGSTFGDVIKLDSNASGESQVAVHNSTVYVISGGLDLFEVNGLFLLKSTDEGETFADPVIIDADGKFANPTNVEVVSDGNGVAYVAGQVFAGGNEEILLMPVSENNATAVVNLSNNTKISECPSIAMAGDDIYVVWEDLTPGNHEILYAKGSKT